MHKLNIPENEFPLWYQMFQLIKPIQCNTCFNTEVKIKWRKFDKIHITIHNIAIWHSIKCIQTFDLYYNFEKTSQLLADKLCLILTVLRISCVLHNLLYFHFVAVLCTHSLGNIRILSGEPYQKIASEYDCLLVNQLFTGQLTVYWLIDCSLVNQNRNHKQKTKLWGPSGRDKLK